MRTRRPGPAPLARSAFAGFCFPPEVITLAVRWYLRFALSYRDVEELLAERGIEVDHVTVYRWVQRFAPEFAEAARARQHIIGDRWHVDETYLKVGGTWGCSGPSTSSARSSTCTSHLAGTPRQPAASSTRRSAGPESHPWRSLPTDTASIPASSMRCCRRPSMTRRSTRTTRWRPTTGASRPGFDPCEGLSGTEPPG